MITCPVGIVRWVVVATYAFPLLPAWGATDPVDVIVYGDHVPSVQSNGTPFFNPFVNPVEDNDTPPDSTQDTPTRLVMKTAPGLGYPLGSHAWGHVSWGKYVLLGSYDEAAGGGGQHIDDQRIGVFDTESGSFCQLDVDPSVAANAGEEWLVVKDAAARQTRIFFTGFAAGSGAVIGFVDADMDNDTPCDATSGWYVVRYTRADINNAAATLPPTKMPCPNATCNFDGIEYLGYNATTGRDTLVLNNWFDTRIVIAEIDTFGNLHVPDVHVLPYWQPVGGDGICYARRAVGQPGVDRTRPETDRRFSYSFDPGCQTDVDPPGCAPHLGICPDGTSCSDSEPCQSQYCDRPLGLQYVPCTSDANCTPFGFDLGSCTSCPPVHPALFCSSSSTQHCGITAQCPTGETCVCRFPGSAAQEFAFDGTVIFPTSAIFQSAQGHFTPNLSAYDGYGNLWLSDVNEAFNPSTSKGAIVYLKDASGEHSYYNPTNASVSEIRPEDRVIPFEAQAFPTYYANDAQHVAESMYIVNQSSLQRANFAFGTWLKDSAYKMLLGSGILPSEARRCAGGSNADAACTTAVQCPGGACNLANSAVGAHGNANLSLGGSPPSIWVAPRFTDLSRKHGHISAYLVRVPTVTDLVDGVSGYRPGVAWSGDRLWLVAEHGGLLNFRLRDDGFWSTWHTLPANVALSSGAAVVSNGSMVSLFARGSADGKVYRSDLATALDCTPGNCTFSPWCALPNSPVIDQEPSATIRGFTGPMVAARRSDGKVVYAWQTASGGCGTWSGWHVAKPSFSTDAPPAIAWHTDENKAWIVARETGTGNVKYTRITDSDATAWGMVGTGGSQAPWGTAPGIAFDGARMRVFVAKSPFPNWVYQSIEDTTGWSNWRQVSSLSLATRQPAAANVNGEVNLFTHWFTKPVQEQAME
jgi:hypothetical protein